MSIQGLFSVDRYMSFICTIALLGLELNKVKKRKKKLLYKGVNEYWSGFLCKVKISECTPGAADRHTSLNDLFNRTTADWIVFCCSTKMLVIDYM